MIRHVENESDEMNENVWLYLAEKVRKHSVIAAIEI